MPRIINMLERVTGDILAVSVQNLPYAITTGVIVITAVCMITMWITKEKFIDIIKSNMKKLIKIYIAYSYCFSIVSITFLSREPGSRDSVDLRLFSTFSYKLYDNVYPVENIILFIPFGLLLPVMLRKLDSLLYCMAAGSIFSLSIEVSQLLTKRGYFQIDDIITNILGCVMGACIFRIYRNIENDLIHVK